MTAARPVLLIGARGQIGSAINALLVGGSPVIALTRKDLDLTDVGRIRAVIRQFAPRAIINAAAYTAVDRAESDRARCFAINADAPLVLAEEAARGDAWLVHFSSDYVFDGRAERPYVEADTMAPLNVYGESKAAADRDLMTDTSRHLIVRTSGVFSGAGSNFVTAMLRLARERSELRVVDDQIVSPTSARFVAQVTVRLVNRALDPGADQPPGLYHVAASDATSWFRFAERIVERDPRRALSPVRVSPISTAEFGAAARRPARSSLDSSKVAAALGIPIPTWGAQLDELFAADGEKLFRGPGS